MQSVLPPLKIHIPVLFIVCALSVHDRLTSIVSGGIPESQFLCVSSMLARDSCPVHQRCIRFTFGSSPVVTRSLPVINGNLPVIYRRCYVDERVDNYVITETSVRVIRSNVTRTYQIMQESYILINSSHYLAILFILKRESTHQRDIIYILFHITAVIK